MCDRNIQKDCGACHQKTGALAFATGSTLNLLVTLSASVSLAGAGFLMTSVFIVKGDGTLYILWMTILLRELL